jgi:hypothetical protein
LEQSKPTTTKQKARIEDVRSRMVDDIKRRRGDRVKLQGGTFKFALGLSEQRERWDAWANEETGIFHRIFHPKQTAFIPSILFICVGIAVMIILTNFVFQLALGVQSRNAINDIVSKSIDFNFIFQNMAIGSLNLATCIDSLQLKAMQNVKLNTYINQLTDWPPV